MKRMIIDVSSVMWMCLLVGKDPENAIEVEHEGKKVSVNSADYGYDNAVNHITSVMDQLGFVPTELIFVIEGKHSKARRTALYKDYKAGRDSRPPQAYEAFNQAKEMLTQAFRNVGAQIVSQDGVEADDIIAFLAQTLKGERFILTNDGDLAALMADDVHLIRKGALVTENPYGPFPTHKITVYKALVGDSSDNIKGAPRFGEKAFLDLLVNFGDGGLAAIEGMIKRRTLHELEEDVASFKPFRKVIDGSESVYVSYDVAKLYPNWVNTQRQPLRYETGEVKPKVEVADERLRRWGLKAGEAAPVLASLQVEIDELTRTPKVKKQHVVYDCELIGSERPVFLVCGKIMETGEKVSFWHHRPGDMAKLEAMLTRPDLTWVSFNGNNFDAPIINAALSGKGPKVLKQIAHDIIHEDAKAWHLPDRYNYREVAFDHIDLAEVAPGVRISLKAYAGRMGYPTMVDLPFDHDRDLTEDELVVLESYCQNDLGVTEWLFERLASEIELRTEMSEEYGIDLRSKSDAQVAEAVLKKVLDIKGRGDVHMPAYVSYRAPDFIETDSEVIQGLIKSLERAQFTINRGNGSPEAPEFLKEPIKVGWGTYQCGIGGLHSTHDTNLHIEATEGMLISDFDVASYYPNIMLKAGLTPRMEGGRGPRFIEEYRKLYERRMEAKRAGNKKVANSLKITLNGTFGKLGSIFSAFYSPDLMLAVTLTGQLNLLCLIHELEKTIGVSVMSANTDGIMVVYPPSKRQIVLDTIAANAARTGFEYEETPYSKVAMKDVNNYLAITTDGKVKRKGLYAEKGLMKNPTMQVCGDMAVDYLKDGLLPHEAILKYQDMTDFVSIRAVKGGGIQYESTVEVDDWILVKDLGTKDNEWRRPGWEDGRVVRRKSRPKPVDVGVGGEPFGRIARWYMTTQPTQPICYVGSGNKVPKTEGAKLCMTLPTQLPEDLDLTWYINETLSILKDMGVEVEVVREAMAA